MKACKNPKCFYHVEVVVREEENDRKQKVRVAYCKEGLQNRLKFLPTEANWCPTCQSVADIMNAEAWKRGEINRDEFTV